MNLQKDRIGLIGMPSKFLFDFIHFNSVYNVLIPESYCIAFNMSSRYERTRTKTNDQLYTLKNGTMK